MTPILCKERSRKAARSSHRGRRKRLRGFERLEDRALLAAFTVNSLLDTVDANPGDGMAQDAAGQTTLRAAIMEANALTSNDSIILDANTYVLSLAGRDEDAATMGDLDIRPRGALTISGAGPGVTIVDAAKLDRALHVLAGANVTLVGVTFRNGSLGQRMPTVFGGGIQNDGTLSITDVTIMGNSEYGIHNSSTGTLTISRTNVSGNHYGDDRFFGVGGGIINRGGLTVISSMISGNTNVAGGAGISNSGTMTIVGSIISNNHGGIPPSPATGVGIHNVGTATISSTTISGNGVVSEFGLGGAIHNVLGSMTLTNTTVSRNFAPSIGAIANDGQLTIRSSTITSNISSRTVLGAVSNTVSGTLTLQNTIIGGNTSDNSEQHDFSGIATSLGNNLIGNTRDSSGWIASDLLNVDPRLDSMADNGGSTMTHALLPDSPAIDAGNNSGAPATDQRGNRRPRDGDGDGVAIVDIGSFEFSVDQSAIEALNDTATVNEDTTASIITVLANDTGPSGSMLSVVAVSQPTNGSAAIGANGAHVVYTPQPNFVGTDTFGYTVTDGTGTVATAMVTVTVVNVDTDLQGTAGDDMFLVRRDVSGANVQVFANDTGTGAPAFSMPLTSVSSLLFEALAGDDRLIVDLVNGNPIPSGGIQYLGGNHGPGGDQLIVRDRGTATGAYIPDATAAGNGIVTIGGRNITLTGVEPIDVSGLSSFTLITPNAADALSISSPTSGITRLAGTGGALVLSPVTFTDVATFILDAATNDAGAGTDALTVSATGTVPNGFGFLQFRSGTGTNTLTIESGTARVDATVDAGGTLNTTMSDGAQLITHRFRQNSLTLSDDSRATILPDGTSAATSVLNTLTINDGSMLDINDNALIVDYMGDSPAATIRQRIVSGRGGVGVGQGTWTGTGITSSTAQQANATEPDARSVGYAENATLPLGRYSAFRGQPVDDTAVLIAYTRTGDANLDGVANDDDVTIVGATYSPGLAQPHWALGDFDYNGFVDDDDVTLLGVLYNPNAPPLAAPPPAPLMAADDNGEPTVDALVHYFSSLGDDQTVERDRLWNRRGSLAAASGGHRGPGYWRTRPT
jgi:hypothetical protein